jgi:MFS family permease
MQIPSTSAALFACINTAPASVKNAAQGLITFATYGIGMLIGSYVSGFVTETYAIKANGVTSYNWQAVWLFSAAITAAVMILFALFFTKKIFTEN